MNLIKHQPPGLPGVLERERLLSKLASWSNRKLVIIHGPAGQGKSTLAADHVRSLNVPSLWYTLEACDDDPHLFLECLGREVRRVFPGAVPAVPPVPRDRYRGSDPSPAIAHWLGSLFQNVPSCLLVFDDYHILGDSPALPQILDMIIDATSPGIRIMVLSRTKPDLPLGLLRRSRAIGELTGAELRFTEAEVAELFSSVFGSPLAKSEAAAVCRMTEGWAVGLTLLHEYLAAARVPEADAITDRLRNEFREQVFDYLASEVFSHLDPVLQEFLVRTSIADAVPLALAEELTGLPAAGTPNRPSVASLLAELGRKNLFSGAGHEEQSIRYHALFREFLAKQLAARHRPAEVRRLYATAARYFVRSNNIVRAVDLLTTSEQYEQAARLLERSCRDLIARGQIRTVLRLIDRFPEALRLRPWFLFCRAVAYRFSDPATALALYNRALTGFRSARNASGQMLALAGVIEAAFHSGGDFRRMERALVLARSFLRQRQKESPVVRATLLLAVGTASFFAGSLRQGIDALQSARDLFRKAGDHFSQMTCAIYLAPCALYQGDFRLAREAVRKGFEAQRAAPDEPGGEAALYLAQAMTELFQGDCAGAQASLERCRRLTEEHRIESIDLLMLTFSGWLQIAKGNHQNAERLLEACMQRGERSDKAFFSLSAAHFLSLSYFLQRKLEKARELAEYALSRDSRAESKLFRAVYLIVRGSVYRELGDYRRAERDLLASARLLRRCDARQQETNAHLALAGLYLQQGKPEQARDRLRRGFTIGRDCALTYFALLSQEELRSFALHAAKHGICPDYCAGLADDAGAAVLLPAVKIFCLGGFRVHRQDAQIRERDWKGKRTKHLVKLLASKSGKTLSREELIDSLRPECDGSEHSAVVRSLVHRARKVLDSAGADGAKGSCIRHENGRLSFNRHAVWTDVEAFQAAVIEAMRSAVQKDGTASLRRYDEAFALYQGDFLPEDFYEDWTMPVREELRLKYLKALDHAAELADAVGDGHRTASYYEQLFTADQCNEKACRWLMTKAIAEGRRSDAIRTYERCQLALRKELDIEPEEKTRRLYRSIIGG